jgi:N-acetylneuraminic acid mutarotase
MPDVRPAIATVDRQAHLPSVRMRSLGGWLAGGLVLASACSKELADPGPDAGLLDAGRPDAAVSDGGAPDSGVPDAGAPDAGLEPLTGMEWLEQAPEPYGVSEAQGVAIGAKLYVFGGFDVLKACCTPTRRAYVYDPASNRWTSIRDLPLGVSHAGFTTDGTDAYYGGGYIEDASRTFQVFGTRQVWRYRPDTDTYEPLPDLPVERAAGQLEWLDGALHWFGGTNLARTADVGDHYVLDLANGATTWTVAASLPNPRNHLGSAVLGGKIYAVGGQHHHDAALVTQDDLDVYDPAADTWTELTGLPVARSHIAQATFAFRGRVLVIGGEVRDGVDTDEVNAYDPTTDTWFELPGLPMPRHSGVGRELNGHAWYTGGDWSDQTLEGVPTP